MLLGNDFYYIIWQNNGKKTDVKVMKKTKLIKNQSCFSNEHK